MCTKILLWVLVAKVACVPSYLNSTSCLNPSSFSLTDVQVGANYYAYTESAQTSINRIVYAPVNQTAVTENYSLSSSGPPRLRISSFTNISSQCFLIFTAKQVQIHTNMNASLAKNLNFSMLPSYTVVDACFGTSNSQVFVLVIGIKSGAYSFLIYNNSFSTAPLVVNTSISTSRALNKMVCRYNKIYTLLQGTFTVLALNSSVTQIVTKSISFYNNYYMDLHVPNNQIMLLLNWNIVYIINQTDWQSLRSVGFNNALTGALILDNYNFAFTDGTYLCLFDYSAYLMMDCIYTQLSGPQKITLLDGKIIMFVDFYQYTDTKIYYYNYTASYIVQKKGCDPTYYYDTATRLCIKNITQPTGNTTSVINNSVILNTINNSNTVSYMTPQAITNSTTVSPSQIFEANPAVDASELQLGQFFASIKEQYQSGMDKMASSAVMMSSMKFLPQFVLSLSMVFDDISYYIFHQKAYPSTANFFMNQPQFPISDPTVLLVINTLGRSTDYALSNNARNEKYLQISTLKSEEIFFTRSFLENYRNSYYITLMFFLAMLLLRALFYLIKSRLGIWAYAHQFARRSSQWCVLLSCLVECNLSRSSFDFGIQIQMPSFDTLLDKINLISCVIFFFVIFVYALTFYQLVYSSCSRKCANIFLMLCRYRMMSFVLQPALVVARSCLRSFCHAFFLSNYNRQIVILFLTDLFFASLSMKMRKLFRNCLVFLLYTLYLVFFSIFDLFFVLESFSVISPHTKRQLFGLILVSALILTCFLVTLTFLALFLYVYIKFCLEKWNSFKLENSRSKAILRVIDNKLFEKQKLKSTPHVKMKLSKLETKHKTKVKKFEASRARLIVRKLSQKDASSTNPPARQKI